MSKPTNPRRGARQKSAKEIAAELLARRQRDFEAVGMHPSAAGLATQASVEVTRAGEARATHKAGPKVAADSARRLDAFEALRDGMANKHCAGAYDAARRLERDIATSLGQHDQGAALDRVDNSNGPDRTDAMIRAADNVRTVMARLPDREQWLLRWLIVPPANRFDSWRAIVAHVTGETQFNAQGASVRGACCNLRDAYEETEGRTKAA